MTEEFQIEEFRIEESVEDGAQVLRPCGELDLAEVPELQARLRKLVCAERETILDLSGLTFIDSSGIQLLFEATGEAKSNGWNLQLRNPSPVTQDTLRLAGVLTLLGLD
jgi:anti-anti-sigma factor